MSSNTHTPNRTYYEQDDDERDMLESLKGLSIKGFQDCNEATTTMDSPSSSNASLPTPPALKTSRVFLASPTWTRDEWYPSDHSIQQLPDAPLLKDLDSFTEGTGQGSFDFLPPMAADEGCGPLIFHPPEQYMVDDDPQNHPITNSLALELLPSPSNLEDVVQAWREDVASTTPTQAYEVSSGLQLEMPPKKRRRSLTQDGDTDERRTRAWSPTTQSSYIAHPYLQEAAPSTRRMEPAAPD